MEPPQSPGLSAAGARAARASPAARKRDIALLTRLTAHLGIIALVMGALLLNALNLSAEGPGGEGAEAEELPPIQFGEENESSDLRIIAVPFTNPARLPNVAPAPARHEVVEYTVEAGDSVTRIAGKFRISPESVLWANAKLQDNPDLLTIGQGLNIPPTSGVLVTVQQGDTASVLAQKYKGQLEDILNDPLNQSLHDLKANPPRLVVGQFLMIPGGEKEILNRRVPLAVAGPLPPGALRGTSVFMWPTAGCIYQIFWSLHRALDIDSVLGTPVVAADNGYVEFAGGGWNFGYGNMVLVNHGNGYWTRYGHLNTINVLAGQSVKKGALVGRMGTTGNSTGPHLHFEVIKNGTLVNPLYYVSGRVPAHCPGR